MLYAIGTKIKQVWMEWWGLILLILFAVIGCSILVGAVGGIGFTCADCNDGIATRCRQIPENVEVNGATSGATLTVLDTVTNRLYTVQIYELAECDDLPVAELGKPR